MGSRKKSLVKISPKGFFNDGRSTHAASKDGEEVAIEIEIGSSDVKENAKKCLDAGIQKVLVLAPRGFAMGRTARRTQDLDRMLSERVFVRNLSSFLNRSDHLFDS